VARAATKFPLLTNESSWEDAARARSLALDSRRPCSRREDDKTVDSDA
jgi:hypothetical protein